MSILIVDDSVDSVALTKTLLKKDGHTDILVAFTADKAFEYLGIEGFSGGENIEIILLDIVMPVIDGIEMLRKIKSSKRLYDVPVIMVTSQDDDNNLINAFEIGAIDYIKKPINKIELLARVKSVLKLKHEMDRRMKLMIQLEEANQELQRLTFLDGLTGIANRRYFDQKIEKEWKRMRREKKPISLVMIDIDFFKKFNDCYGHQRGDDCLKQVALAIDKITKRPGDLAARYGGEEFTLIFPDTNADNAKKIAEKCRANVEALKLTHEKSEISNFVSVSLGLSSIIPNRDDQHYQCLIKAADEALYKAKKDGRNRVVVSN